MAGTTTVAQQKVHGSVELITWTWTADSNGDADAGATNGQVNGKLIWFVTDPDTNAPDDNYDIVINDANGLDVLAAAGVNRDTANTEYVAEASLGAVADSILTLVVANAGDSNQGKVYLYVR